MAKADLLTRAKQTGLVPEDADAKDYTVAQLEELLGEGLPEWHGSMSSSEPLVGPDGHVHLSQEDIDAREATNA